MSDSMRSNNVVGKKVLSETLRILILNQRKQHAHEATHKLSALGKLLGRGQSKL